MYYVVVGGWVLKYAFQYIISGDFGSDKQAYFTDFTTSTVEPIIWAMILLVFVSILLLFGITNLVEKVTKIIMPILFLFLIICGIWAIFVTDNAIEGLKYYLLPDFSKFSFTVIFPGCNTRCSSPVVSAGESMKHWGQIFQKRII